MGIVAACALGGLATGKFARTERNRVFLVVMVTVFQVFLCFPGAPYAEIWPYILLFAVVNSSVCVYVSKKFGSVQA